MMSKYSEYITRNGETWDEVSFDVYGDAFLYPRIMEANRGYSNIITFDGGEVLQIPTNIQSPETLITTPFKSDVQITIVPSPWG